MKYVIEFISNDEEAIKNIDIDDLPFSLRSAQNIPHVERLIEDKFGHKNVTLISYYEDKFYF